MEKRQCVQCLTGFHTFVHRANFVSASQTQSAFCLFPLSRTLNRKGDWLMAFHFSQHAAWETQEFFDICPLISVSQLMSLVWVQKTNKGKRRQRWSPVAIKWVTRQAVIFRSACGARVSVHKTLLNVFITWDEFVCYSPQLIKIDCCKDSWLQLMWVSQSESLREALLRRKRGNKTLVSIYCHFAKFTTVVNLSILLYWKVCRRIIFDF